LIDIKNRRIAELVTAPDPRQHDLFAQLPDAAWRDVKAAARTARHPSGETLFQRGDPAKRFFFVLEGAVKLVRRGSDGHERVIEVIEAGQTFAEAVMFMDRSYPVDAITLAPTTLMGFDSAHFRDLLRASPETCLALLGRLAWRVHMHLTARDDLARKSSTARVAEHLLRHAGDRPGLQLGYPKHVLASRLGMTPESLSRTLSRLRDKGWLAVQGSYLQILDRAALEALAED
jgi:CRP-like cAMP-binding protein